MAKSVTAKQYQQSLVNTSKYYTCDYITEYPETSGDTVDRLSKINNTTVIKLINSIISEKLAKKS